MFLVISFGRKHLDTYRHSVLHLNIVEYTSALNKGYLIFLEKNQKKYSFHVLKYTKNWHFTVNENAQLE